MRPVLQPRRCWVWSGWVWSGWVWSGWVWSAGAVLLALGCSSSTPPADAPEPAPTPSAAELGVAPPASEPSSAAPPPEPAPLLTDGCTARIDPMLTGRQKLDHLARSCIAGMQPLWSEPWMARPTGSGADRTVPVPDPSRCLRVGAAAGPGVTEIELILLDPAGRPLAQDVITGAVALIGLDGPVCASEPGPHRLRVRARGRDEEVAIQVWRAP